MKILVMRYRFIGDTILTVPFLRNLRRAHPSAVIDLMVAPYSSDVLAGIPYVDRMIVYDPPTKHADSGGRHRSVGARIRFLASLRGARYDKVYVLKRSFSSAVIAFLTGARERIGFDTEGRGFLLSRKVPYRHDVHEVENFLEVLRADGVPVADDYLEAWISPAEQAAADAFLAGQGFAGEAPLVGIHPFTANPARAWHPDNFIETANRLQEEFGVRTVVFGGPRERDLAARFEERIVPRPVMAVGTLGLRATMALLTRCVLLICNDSGIMHLAAAVGTPLVALFGPQSPVKFGPWGRECDIIYKRFPCSPCKQKFFQECQPSPRMKPYCMEEITSADVIARAAERLGTFGRP